MTPARRATGASALDADASEARLGPTLLAAAGVSIALALGISDGNLDPSALLLVSAAAALTAAAVFRQSPLRTLRLPERSPEIVLGVGIVLSLVFDALYLPGLTVDPARLGGFRPVLGAIGLLAATHLWPRPPPFLARVRFPLVAGAWLALAAIVLRASPAPGIDVWQFQQAGALALAEGRNPYALGYPNPYGPGTEFLAKELLTPDGRFIRAFPYAPLTLLLGVPSAALGDVRFVHVLAVAAAALLVHLAGRGRRLPELAATLLLVQPRTLLVVELSWTEPTVLAALCGVAVLVLRSSGAGTRPGMVLLGAVAGLALASKQYAPLLLLPFWRTVEPSRRWRVLLVATFLAVATYLPFLAWGPAALWRGVVEFQLLQPFRFDALSWPAAIVHWGGPQLPPWPGFLLAGILAVLGARRVRTVADALAAGALAWLLLVLLNKQAFCNYYWLAAGLLCAAVATTEPPSAPAGRAPVRAPGR